MGTDEENLAINRDRDRLPVFGQSLHVLGRLDAAKVGQDRVHKSMARVELLVAGKLRGSFPTAAVTGPIARHLGDVIIPSFGLASWFDGSADRPDRDV